MPWLKVDDKFTCGPKVKRAARVLGGRSARARVLAVWLDAMSYCAMHLTDGFYPDYELDELPDANPEEVFTAMAVGEVGLGAIVERDEERKGWVFRNYAEYQPTRADVEEKLDWDRRRKALYAIPGLVDAIRRRDKDRCRYCGVDVNWKDRRSPKGGTYDHVQPRGDNSYENVVVCCHRCNARKGGRTPEQAGMPLRDLDQVVTSSDPCDPVPTRPSPNPIPKDQHRSRSKIPAIPTRLTAAYWDDIVEGLLDKSGIKLHDRVQWFKGATFRDGILTVVGDITLEWVAKHYREALERAHGGPITIRRTA